MIVVIEAVLAIVGNEDIRPTVVVIVANSDAETPAVIGDACLHRNIGKCAVMVVVKESRMGRGFFAVEGVQRLIH